MKSLKNKMLFKSALLAGFVMASFAVVASNAAEFKGVYGGVDAGIKDLTASISAEESLGSTGVVGGIIGFRNNLSRNSPLVLGFEADLGLYTSPSDFRYGVSAIAGYNFDDMGLLYSRVGYTRLDDDVAGNLNGLALGAGYEFNLTRSLNIRLDYKYINFNDDDVNQGHEFTTGLIMSF
jgi:opacity protein-like surface antigen